MTQLTASRSDHAPWRALGLSIVFAGAVIAAAVVAQQIATSEGQARAVPGAQTIRRAPGEIPHQVAPLEGPAEVTVPRPVVPLPRLPAPRAPGEIPHQVAPLEGPGD